MKNAAGKLTKTLTIGAKAAKVALHAVAGGIQNVMNGGKFGHGFVSAGITQAFSKSIDGIDKGNTGASFQRSLAAAILGGVTSVATGGKFANGAITGAFSRAFNDENHMEERQGKEKANFDRALRIQISRIHQTMVAYNDPVLNTGYEGYDVGGFIEDDDTNGLFGENPVVGGFTLNRVGINSPLGYTESSGLFSGNCSTCFQKGSVGLVMVTLNPSWNRPNSYYQSISRNIGAPVFLSNINNPSIIRFTPYSVERYDIGKME